MAHITRIYPVIHVQDLPQALENLEVAIKADADGVFLINHQISHHELKGIFGSCRKAFPNAWIGVNFLDLPAPFTMEWAINCEGRVDAVWADYSGISDTSIHTLAYDTRALQQNSEWGGSYFGGVAFKGQQNVYDPLRAAINAAPLMDFITTSGPATGVAADVSKVKAMVEAGPIALASGVSIDNVHEFTPYAQALLVASAISKDFFYLDPEKTKTLVGRVKSRTHARPEQSAPPSGYPQ